MASRRRFPTSVVNHRCRGTPDCTCAFCQDFAAAPPANQAANVAANPAATPATASAGTTRDAPRIPSSVEEATALRAAVDFGGAAPDYLRRGRADSQSGADGPLGDRVGPAIDGVARGATGGEGGGRGEEAIDAQSGREMAAGAIGTDFRDGDAWARRSPCAVPAAAVCGRGGALPALPPPHGLTRLALTAIARRRGLLSDWLLEALVDDTWQIVDLCGSNVSDQGLCHVAQTCTKLVALDIRECNALSLQALTLLLKACPALQVLRMGGSPACNKVARAAVKWMLPQQPPEADPNTASLLASKCPRILLNPAPPSPPPPHSLPPPYCHIPTTLPSSDPSIPPNLPTSIPAPPLRTPLAHPPASLPGSPPRRPAPGRLAFVARDERLAPKRAKNQRQRERREGRDRAAADVALRARLLASAATRLLRL
ncbi:unnamed protein product [Closterium sp. NIES-64]|nr:unnamed protein product [Closterium sp. NIES-64]